jgi:hypothetical protein
MFQAVDPSGGVCRQIYDVASLNSVPERNESKAVEGFYAWSYFDSLKEVKSLRLRRFEQVKKKLMEIPEVERSAMLKADVFRKYTVPSKYFDTIFKLIQTKLLQYCTRYNYNEVRSHHCFVLQGQEVDDYCAVATCQMIVTTVITTRRIKLHPHLVTALVQVALQTSLQDISPLPATI